ncbi:hypothetical protein V5799_017499 [Amblyomma americanum]|uniref:Uncharacterized protein n=1 Tax=Amblyomma americanum TaxID=6943 RepID=A0AAQ4F1Y3_AMBAM
MTSPSTVESLYAFVTASQSPQSPLVCPVRHKDRDSSICDVSETHPAEAVETATHTPLLSEAMTVSFAGDNSLGEHRYPGSTLKRSQSRCGLANATLGGDPSSTPTDDPEALTMPSALAFGNGSLKSRPAHHRASSIANCHELSTADANIVSSAFRVRLLSCALLSLAVLTFHWLAMPLFAPAVRHWSRKYEEAVNVSEAHWKWKFIQRRDDGRNRKCIIYSVGSVMSAESNGHASGLSRSAATVVMATLQDLPCSSWDNDLSPVMKTLTSE